MAENGMGHQLGLWDAPTMDLRERWGIDDVASYLGVPKQTIYSWRKSGYGPKGIRVGDAPEMAGVGGH